MKKTITESELRQLVAEGKTHGEIAKSLGRHQASISATCSVLGITSHRWADGRPAKIEHNTDVYLKAFRAGLTIAETAKQCGLTPATVREALKRAGLPTCARQLLRHEAAQQAQAN